jgi:Nuclease-related domain
MGQEANWHRNVRRVSCLGCWPATPSDAGRAGASALRELEKHLTGTIVRLLHDRRVPGHGNPNIDHLAIGPGGVTAIEAKTRLGKLQVERARR